MAVKYEMVDAAVLFVPVLSATTVRGMIDQIADRIDLDSIIVIPGNEALDEDEDGAIIIPLSSGRATDALMQQLFIENANASNHDPELQAFRDPDFPIASVTGASYRDVRRAVAAVPGIEVGRDDSGGVFVSIGSEEALDAMNDLAWRIKRQKGEKGPLSNPGIW